MIFVARTNFASPIFLFFPRAELFYSFIQGKEIMAKICSEDFHLKIIHN